MCFGDKCIESHGSSKYTQTCTNSNVIDTSLFCWLTMKNTFISWNNPSSGNKDCRFNRCTHNLLAEFASFCDIGLAVC